MKIDSVQITSVRKAGLTIYESLWLETQLEKCPLSVLPGVRVKRVTFRENIWAFCRDKRNCSYKVGVRIKRLSVERGSTVMPLWLKGGLGDGGLRLLDWSSSCFSLIVTLCFPFFLTETPWTSTKQRQTVTTHNANRHYRRTLWCV